MSDRRSDKEIEQEHLDKTFKDFEKRCEVSNLDINIVSPKYLYEEGWKAHYDNYGATDNGIGYCLLTILSVLGLLGGLILVVVATAPH